MKGYPMTNHSNGPARDVEGHNLGTLPAPAPVLPAIPGLDLLSRIYCGRKVPPQHVRTLPDGSVDMRAMFISDRTVGQFIEQVVAPAFPDGFTVLPDAVGAWRDMNTGATYREPSFIVEVAHGSADASRVRHVAETWKKWTQQDAVMVVTAPRVAVAFV
jgi:hypothetical protein